MAIQSAILDGDRPFREMRYFLCTAQAAGHLRRTGMVEHTSTHYGGRLKEANCYIITQPTDRHGFERSLEGLRSLVGCDALSTIRDIREEDDGA